MAETSIPVDLFNPGQVFACLGFLEAADVLCGGAQGGFDWSDPGATRFILRADGDTNPVEAVLRYLVETTVKAIAPAGTKLSVGQWDIETEIRQEDVYPFAAPDSPATLVATLQDGRQPPLLFEHWGDTSSRDNIKFWAGAGGYPGAALLRDALELIKGLDPLPIEDPFNASAEQSSAFRFDWRRDYVPIDVGFSPNIQSSMIMVGYPIVEVMAAYGLSHARPDRPKRRDKLLYRYGVIGSDAPLVFHRAALGCAKLPFPQRLFSMQLDWPGQEGQARCIAQVTEEDHA